MTVGEAALLVLTAGVVVVAVVLVRSLITVGRTVAVARRALKIVGLDLRWVLNRVPFILTMARRRRRTVRAVRLARRRWRTAVRSTVLLAGVSGVSGVSAVSAVAAREVVGLADGLGLRIRGRQECTRQKASGLIGTTRSRRRLIGRKI